MKVYSNFINGEWISSAAKKTFIDVNPANTKDVLGYFQRSQKKDIDRAVLAAKKALPSWSQTPAPKRALVLFKAARLLENKKEELAQVMTREMGKPLVETRADVQEAIDTAYFFAGEGRRLYGQTVPSELPQKMCLTFRRPVGVCGLITPWNFPLAVPSWKVFPALICGNTLVLKPAEDTPLLALLFAEIMTQAGLPNGVFNVVTGLGEEAGRALVQHPDVRLISFTGSSETGAEVASVCGKLLKRHALELGGKNAQIVLEDADLGLAVNGALWGAFATSGQRCTATSRLLLHEKIYKKFLSLFLAETKKIHLGPLINKNQLQRVHSYVQIGKKEGARLICGGKIDSHGEKKNGFFYEPTVFTGVRPKMRIAREEIFGPVVSVISIKNYEEAVQITNNTDYGLSSSLFTQDVKKALSAIHDFDAGITYLNSPTIGAEAHLPFGGVKKTGNGHREAGITALDIFSEWKTVYLDYSGRLQKAQVDT
jgi:alpha-ketoglutaric semialdehyde dehydrogenase